MVEFFRYRMFFISYLLVIFIVTHAEILGPELVSNDEMPVTLSISGTIHALSGDVTGNITITGDDVTINLNQYIVTGRIIISGERALIYGGKVIAPAPADNATADAGVIQINVGADNAQIVDCYVSAADTTVAAVRGARAITVDANDVILRNNFIQAGSSGAVNGLADGGVGAQSSGSNFVINNSQVFGGNGSGSNLSTTTSGAGGIGCNVVANSVVSMTQSICKGGNAGQLTNGANGITTAAGGDGITIASGAQVLIEQSEIVGGDSSIITGPSMATTGSVIGGDGGAGINASAAFLALYETAIQGGSAGNVTIVSAIGSAAFSFTPGSGGAALHIGDTTTGPTTVRSCSLIGGNCGALTTTDSGGTGINNIMFGAIAGNGVEVRHPAINTTAYTIIEYCDLKGGLAQNIISASGLGTVGGVAVFGNNAGDGIVVDNGGSHVDIANCTLMTFKGGDITGVSLGGINTRIGGNGGSGVRVGDIFIIGAFESFIRISNNQILAVGGGGAAPGGPGQGGPGGYGILVGQTAVGIEVSYNTVTNSPGGDVTSASAGTSNYAIFVGSSVQTIIYGNMAYAVAPETFSGLVYALSIPPFAVDAPNGTLFAPGTGRLANIYQL